MQIGLVWKITLLWAGGWVTQPPQILSKLNLSITLNLKTTNDAFQFFKWSKKQAVILKRFPFPYLSRESLACEVLAQHRPSRLVPMIKSTFTSSYLPDPPWDLHSQCIWNRKYSGNTPRHQPISSSTLHTFTNQLHICVQKFLWACKHVSSNLTAELLAAWEMYPLFKHAFIMHCHKCLDQNFVLMDM